MTEYVGGLRARLVRDSLYEMVNDSLTALGWFDEDRQHLPVQFVSEPVDPEDEVQLNTLGIVDLDVSDLEWEMGSNMVEQHWSYALDFFGENNSIGLHMAHDLKAILEGRLPSIDRTLPIFTVYDYSKNGEELFVAHIEDVFIDRAAGWPKPWQKNWFSVEFTVLDYFGNGDE